jgi:hypothetical protein
MPPVSLPITDNEAIWITLGWVDNCFWAVDSESITCLEFIGGILIALVTATTWLVVGS